MISKERSRCDRINQMLSKLSELLNAPKGMFQYREEPYANLDAWHRLVWQYEGNYAVVCADCGEKTKWRFLANRTLDCLVKNINLVKWNEGQFFDYSSSRWYTDETLAESIYDRLCRSVFIEGEELLGFCFQDVTDISEMSYEGETAYGSFLFLPDGRQNLSEQSIQLDSKLGEGDVLLQYAHLRYVRKLLAGVKKTTDQGSRVQGLVWEKDQQGEKYRCLGYTPLTEADQFPIIAQIRGYSKWILKLAGQEVLEFQGNKVHFPRNSIEENMECLREEFELPSCDLQKQDSLPCIEKYRGFLSTLSKQHHGTSVVFLDLQNNVVAEWVNNLEKHYRAQRVKPWNVLDLKEKAIETIEGISRMDGCFIVDYPRGELVFINVIVDGKAIVDGSLGSGSRRNSIPAFLANIVRECPTFRGAAFLFSEDGDLTVVRASTIKKQLCDTDL